ncbi:uncharacterized protein [Apostichopus japonicus]|uniref:uncharacterized protein n=1 Tax=Stichopus japonicus TaxID=307972 RepID=UPI003AB4009B
MPNPDYEFVLHGRKTPLRTKPQEFLSNSLKTSTSRNLSHIQLSSRRSNSSVLSESTKYNNEFNTESGIHSNDDHSLENTENSELSLDLGSLNSSYNKSFNKSVSFNNKLGASKVEDDDDEANLQEEFAEELQRLIDSEIIDAEKVRDEYVAGKALPPNESGWFTEPLHLTKSTEFPVFERLGIKEQPVFSVRRPAGMAGIELAQRTVASNCSLSEQVRDYFPVTLGEVPSIMKSITPSLPPGSNSITQKRTSQTLSASSSKNDTLTLQAASDYNYLKATQPFLDQAVVATPYQYELAKLKMERLRLEEQRLLKMKRENELERIRGPQPKWYELKTPKFTYEHSKNNKLLRSERDWQDLLNYRSELLSSNHKFGTATL